MLDFLIGSGPCSSLMSSDFDEKYPEIDEYILLRIVALAD